MRLIDPIGLKQALAVSAILEDKKTIEQIIDEQPTIEPDPDTVSRQQAIDAIVDRCDVAKWGRCPKTEELVWTLEKLPSSPTPSRQPEQHWIPCSERLPFAEYGESNNVLATCGHRDGEDTSIRWIKTLYFNGGNWCYPTGETYDQKVYAWMPLPEAYREGE